MEVIYGLIPGMIVLGLVAVGVLFWAARSGQFDDLEGDAHRILMDDDGEADPRRFPDADLDPGETEPTASRGAGEKVEEDGRP
ncbi:MAG: cbb3-type cytochrome oxidase assembly protein CcoS [Pseudomonadota bacterium]|nr:cbb3-type cytochrome oxidase assembly protein CcoS [Pseudomonadota bacterium]